jgi:soluble lytic murein transglycosylase-like protein
VAVLSLGCVAAFWPKAEHESLIAEVAGKAGVEAALVKAIVWRVSGFDAGKIEDGGYGLMQLGRGIGMEWAAAHGVESFMVTDLLDAQTNLQAGTWYLSRLFEKWRHTDDPMTFALAEYVAGPEQIRVWTAEAESGQSLASGMRGTAAGDFVEAVRSRVRSAR